ncbi:hypothetical protein RZS08_41270, partial [Arthrospira platensis SPKY1]|nr:hypothetical protein [Arthrospira platensis SPKY1]
PKQWVLSFFNNRVLQLWDLSTGEPYPPDLPPLTGELVRELDAIEIPETCWGLSSRAVAFSPDGSRLLAYRHSYKPGNELLALFGMPSGKLVRDYEGYAHIERIHIAPNNRIAAISTDFYRKTWIIDLE